MKMWYIKEIENKDELLDLNEQMLPVFLKRIISYIRYRLNISQIIDAENKVICIVPILNGKNTTDKKCKLIIQKLLKNNQIRDVTISNYINNINIFKDCLYRNKVNILNGRWLFNYVIYDIITYICKLKEEEIEKQEISFLVNDTAEVNIQNIILMSQNIKILNIITNNPEKFKSIESYLYDTLGISIRIVNNKKKSLLKSNIIINIDFLEDELNKYTFPKNVILINVNQKVKIKSKSFQGIIVNFYKIQIPNKYIRNLKEDNIYHNFEKNILYESIIFKKDNFKNICKNIKQDNVTIVSLMGNNGLLSEEEFTKTSSKNLDKSNYLS